MKNKNQLPTLKFWINSNPPIAVAHRGGDGAGIEKENSIKAFRAAYDLGYRWFETDVVATKDKALLAIHGRGYQLHPNKDLPSRTKIGRMKLQKVHINIKIGGEKVPLLEELLDEFTDVKFFVDPKTFGSVAPLIKLLSSRPSDVERVCIGSFSKMRTLRTSFIIKRNTKKEVCTSILGPWNAYPVYVAARLRILVPFAKHYVQETNAGSLHVPFRWITNSPKAGKKLIRFAHELGLKVAVYTPNGEEDIKNCLLAGVDVVMSDRVHLLNKITEAKHKGNLA